jgi:error-prone DNA polymerase
MQEDMPDVDLDFGRDARDKMFRHIFETYGTSNAAQVAAVTEYHYPYAIRDVGLALGLAPGDLDKLAKRLRSRFASSLFEELKAMPEFEARLRSPIWQQFVELVEQLKGMPRHLTQHSGGVILSTQRIDEQVPVERAAMESRYIAQWDKDSVADAGFFKLDILGYPTLDQLELGLKYVYDRYGKLIKPEDIDLTDQRVYEMIQRAGVIGIVQIQSRAQQQILLRIKIARIEDLIIQVALIRPGPIQGGAVHPYVARCLGQEPVTYDHPSLEPVLAETKGVIVFQEQVIGASMAIAGFSAGQAEQLRRAMSRKRSLEAMEALREEFLTGARRNGVSDRVAVTVFDKIVAFSSFGFPKSHAAALAQTAFQAAWLKLYYPAEFYAALLNNQPMGFYTPEVLCNDARRDGLEILPADINKSEVPWTIEHDKALRVGLGYVAGVGESARERLREEATSGSYRSLWDFWQRARLPRETIENLIRVGAFTWTGLHERELIWQLGTFYRPLNAQQPLALSFSEKSIGLREMTHIERVAADLSLIGLAVRGHSMDLVDDQMHEGYTPSHLVEKLEQGVPVTVAGLVAVRQAPETAKGFVFHTLEDRYGLTNIITRPSLIPRYRDLIERAPALVVHGHIERQERAVNVIAERFEGLHIATDAERRVHSFG